MVINMIIEKIMAYQRGNFPITYLRIPLRKSTLKKEDWRELIDRLQERLEGWQKNYLSLGGRTTLINSIISTIPLYTLSVYRLSTWVKRRMDGRDQQQRPMDTT